MPKLKRRMKISTTNILILSFFLAFACCKSKHRKENIIEPIISTEQPALSDSLFLHESFQKTDSIVNDYLTEELKIVRENFKKINSVEKWDLIKEKNLWETTEGGIVKYYFLDDSLRKMIVRRFGDTFQYLAEFYLLKGELSFVFEKHLEYNRPITYDSINMVENNDNQVFDFEKSEIVEERSYFLNGKLVHQLNNQDCGAPIADDFLMEEQKRIQTEFKNLLIENKKSEE